jgi:hypothetical protein
MGEWERTDGGLIGHNGEGCGLSGPTLTRQQNTGVVRRIAMSQKNSRMYELIGRAIADPDFRAALIADPEKAIKEAGYELTQTEMASLRELDLKAAAEELGERRMFVIRGTCASP